MALMLSRSQLADLLSVTVRTITDWQREPDFPTPTKRSGRNTYDATVVVKWWRDREIGRLIEGDDGTLLDLAQERAKLARAQRIRQELLYQVDLGQFVSAEETGVAWGRLVTNFRARMLAIPNKAASLVAGEDRVPVCAEILRAAVYEALTELSETGAD